MVSPLRRPLHYCTAGGHCDENARGWINSREKNGQDFQTNGQEYGWKTFSGGIYRGNDNNFINYNVPLILWSENWKSIVALLSWNPSNQEDKSN